MLSARGHVSGHQTVYEKHDPAVKVVGDNGLMYILNKKQNDPIWKNVDYIQTNIKVKLGCGFPFIIHFFARIEGDLTPETEITYDYKQFGEDVVLMQSNQERYCLKQVYMMCFYLQKLYFIEVLRMKCVFVRDDNGTIWFQHASNIFSRVNELKKNELVQQHKRMEMLQQAKMEKQRQFEQTINAKPAKVQALKLVMNDHFERLKDETGLTLAQQEAEKVDDTSETVFKQLRPKSELSFHDYIKYENSLPRHKKHQEALRTSVRLHSRKLRPPSNTSAILHQLSL